MPLAPGGAGISELRLPCSIRILRRPFLEKKIVRNSATGVPSANRLKLEMQRSRKPGFFKRVEKIGRRGAGDLLSVKCSFWYNCLTFGRWRIRLPLSPDRVSSLRVIRHIEPSSNQLPGMIGRARRMPMAMVEVVREGARRMLLATIEAEADGYIEKHHRERDAKGHRLVVRNGYAKERRLLTGLGELRVRAPRVNNKWRDETGWRIRFTSKILPPYLRKTKSVEELIPGFI